MMTNVTLLLVTLRTTVMPTKSETVVLSTWLIWIKDQTMSVERSEAISVISSVLVSLVSVLMLASTCGQAIWNDGWWTGSVQTCMPDGEYCDLMQGDPTGSGCTGPTITVSGGRAKSP